ncbi:MAG TPA: metal-dependent hydrolase [Burkholderiales bacterium]|nr:metal-dependent hydrolase [Burkholderiales bacterium]
MPPAITARREDIPVRRMDFDFGADIPEAWADGNALITSLMAGLSAVFPPGERFFIDSVRHYASQVTDPDLKKRIRGFIGQEANHTKEHIAFNRFLDARGFDVWKIERFVEARLRVLRKRSSPEANLARTAALEHMTALLASAILEDGDFLEQSHPTIAAFWKWHAIEEIEHRSVAFDVYRECVDDEELRRRTMAFVTVFFCTVSALRTVYMMKKTGHLLDVRAWTGGLNRLLGRRGVLRRAFPLYRAYYRPSFHPDEHDNRAAVERARSKYLGADRAAAA